MTIWIVLTVVELQQKPALRAKHPDLEFKSLAEVAGNLARIT